MNRMSFKEMGESSKRKSLKKLEKQLKKYMKKSLAKGYKFEELKKALVEKNWPEHYIYKCYSEIKNKKENGILKKILAKPKIEQIEKIEKIEPQIEEEKLKIKRTFLGKSFTKEKKIINADDLKKSAKKDEYATDLDLVLNIVEKYNKVKISDIAANFKVDKKRVEEWGRILEEHDLIKVHYPAVGEPEFVKKDFSIRDLNKKKMSKKKKMIISLIVILVVIVGVAALFITPPRRSDGAAVVEAPKIIKVSAVKEAFSGKASYICKGSSEDVELQYIIKNKDMRIESKINDEDSIIIVKEGNVYTYLASEDKWIKKTAPSSLVAPSSGKIPEISLSCEKADVKDNKFSISEDKVIEINF